MRLLTTVEWTPAVQCKGQSIYSARQEQILQILLPELFCNICSLKGEIVGYNNGTTGYPILSETYVE